MMKEMEVVIDNRKLDIILITIQKYLDAKDWK